MSGSASIRPVREEDADAVAAIYAPNIVGSVISFEADPPDAAEMRCRIAAVVDTHPWLVCEHDGKVVGYVYASSHSARTAYQWSTNVTVYIDASIRRAGVGQALYTSLFALLRLHGFHNAYAGITLPNDGSVGLHETMGFQPVGVYRQVGYKMGAWHDVGWWAKELLAKSPAPPAPPRRSDAVRADARWQSALDAGLPLLRLGGDGPASSGPVRVGR